MSTATPIDPTETQGTTASHGEGSHGRGVALVLVLFALLLSFGTIAMSDRTPVHQTAGEESAKAQDVQNVAPAVRASTAARTARVASVGRVARIAHAADAARGAAAIVGLTVAGSIMASSRYRRRTEADGDETLLPPSSFLGWRVPWFDRFSQRFPASLGAYSPMLSGVAGDSAYLRAMVGPASLVLPAAGIILGVAASSNVHQTLAAPDPALFVPIMLLGALDGSAGLLALLVMFTIALFTGNVNWHEGPIALLLLGTLWFGLAQVVAKVRTFTRPSPEGVHQWWRRAGDMLIGPALGGYLAASLTNVLPVTIISGEAAAEQSMHIGLAVGVVFFIRYWLTFLASHVFPHDLVIVHPSESPERKKAFGVASHFIEVALIMLLFVKFLGPMWLAVPLLVFFALDLVVVDLIPTSSLPPWLYRLIPRNVGKILFISLLAVALESIIALYVEDELIRIAYLLIGITVVGVVHTWLGSFDGEDMPDSTRRKVGGMILASICALQLGGFLF